jgi:hypothetical protein
MLQIFFRMLLHVTVKRYHFFPFTFYVIDIYLWSIFASTHPFELPEEKFA